MKRVREFLYVRNGTYYFRRSVPQEARGAFGRTEVCVSLQTKNLPEARLLLARHLKEFERTLAQATGRPDPTIVISPTVIEPDRDQIDAAVRAWVKDRGERRLVEASAAPARLVELRQQASMSMAGYEAGQGRAGLQTEWIAEAIREQQGWRLPEGSSGFDYLVRLVARRGTSPCFPQYA